MKCKNCGSEILEGENFCGNCGAKVTNNEIKNLQKVKEEKTEEKKKIEKSDENKKEKNVNDKSENKKLKKDKKPIIMNIIIILLIIVVIILGKNVIEESKKFGTSPANYLKGVVSKQPEWITSVNGEKVFNIPYDEFVEKCKTRLKELSDMNVEQVKKGEMIAGEISYPEGWIIVTKQSTSRYAYNQLGFTEYTIGRMLFIEESGGKVKSITFLQKTDALPSTIAEEAVTDVLKSYNVYDENDSQKFRDNVNITDLKYDNATALIGKFFDSQVYVDAYRKSGYFGYIPYAYNKREVGNYLKITIK